LVWDGSGLSLIYKRLEQASFIWPRIEDGLMRLSPGQLGALFEGSTGSVCTAGGCLGRSSRNDPATE
jgi:transposase